MSVAVVIVYVLVRRPLVDGLVTVAVAVAVGIALLWAGGRCVVVNRDQVKRSMRKAVRWSEVNYVEYLGSRERSVTLQLKNGTSWETGLPLSYREEVARIGRVPLGKGFRQPPGSSQAN